ncbi:FAD-dependent oxidoreductase [Eggerthella sinensis]|uniref:FAD-dependent oxidoreductase n=1 Tax=Eggerthella sinensis TaxID=242230 RepID=UPI00248F292A|nr:FAD-dependent oxidoreductase [Eggerthella sinensis]
MNMDRRKFLSTAAVAGGVAAFAGLTGCSPTAAANGSESKETEDVASQEKSADIVIVGAGGAGLCAALTAEKGGASVILLEALSMTGGATIGATSSNVCGSKMQKDAGVEDTPETILASYENDIRNPYVLEMAKTYAENNGATHDWLKDEIGVDFVQETLNVFPPYPVARCLYAVGGGQAIVDALTSKVQETSIELMLDTTAKKLIKEDGTVVGLVAQDAKGRETTIAAKAVILATGGFAANRDIVPFHELDDAMYYGVAGSDGKWVSLAAEGGAMLLDMWCVPLEQGGLQTSPGFGQQIFSPVLQSYVRGSGILVNPDGARIANEMKTSNERWVEAYRSCPDSTAYLFLDKATYDIFYSTGIGETGGAAFAPETMEKWLAGDDKDNLPLVVTSDTVEGVAAKAGIDAAGLQATIDAFNADAASGMDSAFGRPIKAPIGEGPYYIVGQNLRYAHSFGGLVANGKMEVLDWTETPMKGLYGAGQALRSIQGDYSKPSTSTSFAYTSGCCAARSALETL